MRKHRYAIYFTQNDGDEDAVEVESRMERDTNIKDMLKRKEFKKISYCTIYHNGEYGEIKKVL